MCPVPSTVHLEPICCECQAKFGGYLPVPRAKAALPYWVPRSLRPQNQKPLWMCAPGTTAGGSVVKGAISSSGSSSRLFTRLGRWPRGSQKAPQPPSCPSTSAS
uniref:Uncharacterized protein n=1 Tax=Bos mutus grunniens TaxID=30521 RepID=A0A8B9XJM4_BOSMU